MNDVRKRVAVIGAGASGLTSARQALTYGVEPVLFEASHCIGGLWHFKPEETDGKFTVTPLISPQRAP